MSSVNKMNIKLDTLNRIQITLVVNFFCVNFLSFSFDRRTFATEKRAFLV